jgi:hypothetical protein
LSDRVRILTVPRTLTDKGVRPMAVAPRPEDDVIHTTLVTIRDVLRHGDLDVAALLSALLLIGVWGLAFPLLAIAGWRWTVLDPFIAYVPACVIGLVFLMIGLAQLVGLILSRSGRYRQMRAYAELAAGCAWLFLAIAFVEYPDLWLLFPEHLLAAIFCFNGFARLWQH